MEEVRKSVRFYDFGKVECPKISVLPGVLNDISQDGLKVTFPITISMDISELQNEEFELLVRSSRIADEVFKIIAIPVWKYDHNSDEKISSQIGFSIIHSKDSERLINYLEKFKEDDEKNKEWAEQVMQSVISELNTEEKIPCQIL